MALAWSNDGGRARKNCISGSSAAYTSTLGLIPDIMENPLGVSPEPPTVSVVSERFFLALCSVWFATLVPGLREQDRHLQTASNVPLFGALRFEFLLLESSRALYRAIYTKCS